VTKTADWAQKLEEAERLEADAKDHYDQYKDERKRAAVLRAQAEREREAMESRIKPRRGAEEPLLAAAGLAVADLGEQFQPGGLALALEVSETRAEHLLELLEARGLARRAGGPWWAAVDPEERRARDVAIELATFTEERLAEKLGLTPIGARHYIGLMLSREQLSVEANGDGPVYTWQRPDTGTVTARRVEPTPEDAAVAREPRGETVALTGKARGSSHSPRKDRERQLAGHRVKKSGREGRSKTGRARQ
jgi:hypothetical protein